MANKNWITSKELFESEIKEPGWVVDKIISDRGITLFAGEPATSKTLLSMHIAICVATGKPVLGKFSVKRGRVLYIDEENRLPRMKDRLVRMILGTEHGPDIDIDFMICKNVKLNEPTKKWTRELQQYIQERKPVLIICDSLVRMMVGDENKSEDVRRIYDNIKDLDASWLLLHHTSKEGKTIKSVRGSGDFTAMVDDVFKLRKSGKNRFFIKQEKSRGPNWLEGIEYEIIGDELDPIEFRYSTEMKEVQEQLSQEIENWLKEKEIKVFKKRDVIKEFDETDYAINNALKILKEKDIISPRNRKGTYQVNELTLYPLLQVNRIREIKEL